jgi:cob(I)alamin adenosyltransferase
MTRSRIYTKTGDDGTTGLLHGGRVSKGDELVDAYGDIDESVARQLRPVFVVPGTTLASAMPDLGRDVVRRAERRAVRALVSGDPVSDEALRYLNRLSDLQFVLARHAAPARRRWGGGATWRLWTRGRSSRSAMSRSTPSWRPWRTWPTT